MIGQHGMRNTARMKTYVDVLVEYEMHPESKYADARAKTCSKQTIGLLYRRHVFVDGIKYIGKESGCFAFEGDGSTVFCPICQQQAQAAL
jgi:hypothetical protein